MNISCVASGKPEPDVTWSRNGRVKSSGKKKAFLIFNSVKRTDDGQYTCKANNSVNNISSPIKLVVDCK